jgi:hypothetical protein
MDILRRRCAGMTPAATNQDLPTPKSPGMPMSRVPWRLATTVPAARLRPKPAPGAGFLEGVEAGAGIVARVQLHGSPARQQRLERGQELRGAGHALGLALLEAGIDDVGQLRRHVRAGVVCAGHGLIERGCDHEVSAVEGRQGMSAHDHAVEHDAHGPEVGAVIDRICAPLLGRHVRPGTDQHAIEREPGREQAVGINHRGIGEHIHRPVPASHHFGHAEIEYLDGAGVGHEDVGGLQVAVDDLVLVRAHQRAYHRHHELHGAAGRQLAVADELAEGLAFEVLEHHEGHAAVLLDVVDDHDVLVGAARRGPGLEQEALAQGSVGVLQELDGHAAGQLGVAGEVDVAHAAAAELAYQLVVLDDRTRCQAGAVMPAMRIRSGHDHGAAIVALAAQRLGEAVMARARRGDGQQAIELLAQRVVVTALAVEKSRALGRRQLHGGLEQGLDPAVALALGRVSYSNFSV